MLDVRRACLVDDIEPSMLFVRCREVDGEGVVMFGVGEFEVCRLRRLCDLLAADTEGDDVESGVIGDDVLAPADAAVNDVVLSDNRFK